MLEFNFDYKEHKIKYTVDVLGREKCFVDGELVHKISTPWTKSVIDFKFLVGDEELMIYRRLLSYKNAEYQITLTDQKKIIEKQSREYWNNELGLTNEQTFYKNDERSWVDEIKPPQKIFTLGFLTYILAVFITFSEFVFATSDVKYYAIAIISAVISYAIFDVLKILKNAFFTKVKPEADTEIPEMI